MLYYATPSGRAVTEVMKSGVIGMITTPRGKHRIPPGVRWCADNDAYGGKYPGDDAYLRWLAACPEKHACGFATAPDVLYDAAGTLERSLPMLREIRKLGIPAALVAQNGMEDMVIPWDEFDVLFLGGDTEWKLGPAARELAGKAASRNIWVHMGRVNSKRRLFYAQDIGCSSADGTYLVFGPDVNLPKLLNWLKELSHAVPLSGLEEYYQ